MAKAKKKETLTPEERLQAVLVPDWEQPYKVPENWCWIHLLDSFENCTDSKKKIPQKEYLQDGKIAVVAELFRNIEFTPRWKRYINEAFPVRTQAATARMMSVLEERGIGPPKKNYASHGLLRVIDH